MEFIKLPYPFQFNITEKLENPLGQLAPKDELDEYIKIIQPCTVNMCAWSAMAKYKLQNHLSSEQ